MPDLIDRSPSVDDELLASISQAYTTVMAYEQGCPDLIFEVTDTTTYGRLANA
jgi:hypothetical protein